MVRDFATLAAFNRVPAPVFVLAPDGECTYANPVALAVLGCPPSAMALPDGTEGPHQGSHTFHRADGSALNVLLSLSPERLAAGTLEGWIGTWVPQAPHTAAGDLEERLRLAGAIFEHAVEGIMVTDTSGNIVAVNPAFEEITGYSAQASVGKPPPIFGANGADRAAADRIVREVEAAGRWSGEVWSRRRNGEVYPQWVNIGAARDATGATTHHVTLFSDVTALRASELRLEHLSQFDQLTGLPNRALLLVRLERAVAQARHSKTVGAVVFLDIDRFKTINDSLGHAIGDELLKALALRLQARRRAGDTFARLGGDEFVLLVEGLGAAGDAATVAMELADALAEPFMLAGGSTLYASASIGLSVFPEHGIDAAGLVGNAEAAMYQAKKEGRATFRYYTPALTQALHARLEMETRLRGALERAEFLLQYQAKVDIDGKVTGAEALVRWQPQGSAMIPPNHFVPLAEDTGLIVPIGDWVLWAACSEARRWLDAGHPTPVAVNLSNVQFRSKNLVRRIRDILEESGLPPWLLEIEITESAVMESVHEAVAHLQALRELGVRLALDDFGTGFSSLASLKILPLHVLKIDQSFVRGLPDGKSDTQIVRTILTMAENLGLEATAEGVETAAQLALLRELGCRSFQGYLLARPESAAAFGARLGLA